METNTTPGADPAAPIYGPAVRVKRTGEIGSLVCHNTRPGIALNEQRFCLKLDDGSFGEFTRQELEDAFDQP
jgi:hypothetical protein